MKKLFSFLVLLVAAFVFTACGNKDGKETIDFGMLGPFTGALSQMVNLLVKGALAIEEDQ